ncbi:MAG: hypothetical protein HYS14_07175 [Candidatus Rokubacteria bacterium]|nr:hypothetical protein [Candidatus Rokubacteria bacterium]
MRLRGATKFLLACWAAAVTIGGTGYAFRATADARLAKLVGECEQARRPSQDKIILIRVREKATGRVATISAEAYLRDTRESPATYALVHEIAPARRGLPPLAFTRFGVQIPGVGTVEFPSQMTDEHIVTAIRQYFRSLCDPSTGRTGHSCCSSWGVRLASRASSSLRGCESFRTRSEKNARSDARAARSEGGCHRHGGTYPEEGRMTKRLGILFVLSVLLAAPLALLALDATPGQILDRPDQFDGKAVTLVGTVRNLDARVSRRGNPYYTFDLAAGGRSIKIFSFGRPPCPGRSAVSVEGVFQKVKRVSGRTFYNEVEAQRVVCQ